MSQDATIRRGVRNARYAAIPNHVFEDENLSMEARWLLAYLLSKPDNWKVIVGDISNKGRCGRDKVRKMIAELVDTGYAEREQQRADGKFGSSVLVVFDEPRSSRATEYQGFGEGVASLPQTDLPATAKPSPASPSPVKTAHSNNLDLENTDGQDERAGERDAQEGQQEPIGSEPAETHSSIERAFRRWFPAWPTYVGDSEDAARKAWFDLGADDRVNASSRTRDYLDAVKGSGRKLVCSAAVYLRERRWEKLPPKPAAAEAPAVEGPFGKGWGALRMADLLQPPRPLPPLTRLVEQMILSGAVDKVTTDRERLAKFGWPRVVAMHEAASHPPYRGTMVPPEIKALGADFINIRVGGDLWDAWKRLHEARGWPWLPDTGKLQHVWLPPIPEGFEGDTDHAVQAAMDLFAARVREVRGDEHAA